jgi:hypothetical protein
MAGKGGTLTIVFTIHEAIAADSKQLEGYRR